MQIFNTMTGQLERFTPRGDAVKMYVCGVTPYDTTHVGHAFTFLTFDILARLRLLDLELIPFGRRFRDVLEVQRLGYEYAASSRSIPLRGGPDD